LPGGDPFPLERIFLQLKTVLAFERFVWVVLSRHYLKVVEMLRLIEDLGVETQREVA
jgi:hypothetical protein